MVGQRRTIASSFTFDIFNTAVTSFITMAALVLVTRWVAGALTVDEFGIYGLSRRVVTSVAIYSNVTGLSLARFLAMDEDRGTRQSFLLAAAICTLGPAGALLLASLTWSGPLAALVFHDATRGSVLVSTAALVAGTASFNFMYAWYRGGGKLLAGNIWQVWVIGVAPLAVAWLVAPTGRVDLLNDWTSAVMFLSLVPLVRPLASAVTTPRARLRVQLRQLVGYAAPRIPGGLAFGAMLTVGPFIAPRVGALAEAGFLVAGLSLLRIVDASTTAFGVVALPKVAELLSKGRLEFVRDRVGDVIAMAAHFGLFVTAYLVLWTDVIVRAWLGDRYLPGTTIIRVILASGVPYLAYTMLRSVIDAVEERAINTGTVVISLAVTVIASLVTVEFGGRGVGLALAAAFGLVVLGALSIAYLWRKLRPDFASLRLSRGALCAAVALLPSIAGRALLPAGERVPFQLAVALGAGAVGVVALAFLLRRSDVRWVREIELRLWRRSAR